MSETAYDVWQRDRQHRLDALVERLSPDLAVLLPRIAEVAQAVLDHSSRPDGAVSHPDALGQRVAHEVGPLLEHGSEGGWCPRCGRSAALDTSGPCASCAHDLDQPEDVPCGP